MTNQLPTLGGLSSIFQLAAGVALAMSVFRAPFERRYNDLGSILDREQALLKERTGDLADAQADRLTDARIAWLTAGHGLEPSIRRRERFVWVSVGSSALGLVAAALWPDFKLCQWEAVGLIALALGPVLIAWGSIVIRVRQALTDVTRQIREL